MQPLLSVSVFFFFNPSPPPSHFKPLILLWKVRVGGGLSEATLQSPWPRASPRQHTSTYQEVIICVHLSMSRPGGLFLRSLPGLKVDPFTLTMTGMCPLSLTFVPRWWFSLGWQPARAGGIPDRPCGPVACVRNHGMLSRPVRTPSTSCEPGWVTAVSVQRSEGLPSLESCSIPSSHAAS